MLPVDQRLAQRRVADNEPAGAQPRQPVGLRQATEDDGPLVEVGGRGQPVGPVALQAAVHLVTQQPGAAPPHAVYEGRELGRVGQVAGRVMGEVDHDQACVGRQQPVEFIQVERPAVGRQLDGPVDGGPGHVRHQVEQRIKGRRQHNGPVAGVQQGAHGQVDAFFRCAQHDYLGRIDPLIERGHGRPQRRVAG